jgi:GTP pyrophosphokinase
MIGQQRAVRKGGRRGPSIEKLLEKIRSYNPACGEALLRKAFDFASSAHAGQTRLTGHPYITHSFEVALILAELELDDASICCGLLHDTVEDTSVTLEDLRREFGEDMARLVEGVTSLRHLHFHSRREHQAENLRRMLLAMAKDLRVILVKLADRLHNLRTLHPHPPEKQQEVVEETIQIFAPIAHRLGIWRLKWDLEDLSLRYLDPEAYRQIKRRIARSRQERERTISTAIEQLRARLEARGIEAEIRGRPKHFYSIYQKMRSQGVDFGQILDLEAIRVLANTIPDCYAILGEVHNLWLPLPDMFSDHIAKPKPNLYRSLHTKVIGPRGSPMEVQIRTWEMHREAEYGVAAHWRYKEGLPGQPEDGDFGFERKLSWLRQLIELQSDVSDPGQWLNTIKLDLFKDQVFVFTPRGDVIDLPVGSTPIDFAYRIHTDIGHHCTGARVNGKLVPLNYAFRNGDVCEILTSKSSRGPSSDWLAFAATSPAKSRIRQWFRRVNREENIQLGRRRLEEECHRAGLGAKEVLGEESLASLAQRMNYASAEDLLAAVGYHEIAAETVINRLAEGAPKKKAPPPGETARGAHSQTALQLGISATGAEDMLLRRSRCCAPLPGDDIIGYVTRGKGIAVHRADCPNISLLRSEPGRLLNLEWTRSPDRFYPTPIVIEAIDRVGLLQDLLSIVSADNVNISTARATTKKGKDTAQIYLVLDVTDAAQLNAIVAQLARHADVLSTHRVQAG